MKSSENGRISDELLSAYIDNAVTEQERNLVEAAVAADAQVAWRLDTLEQTVQMLRSLPELALPRSFTLQESQLLETGPSVTDVSALPASASMPSRLTAGWRSFWRSGAVAYRNLAAASLAVLLALVAGRSLIQPAMNNVVQLAAPAGDMAFSEAPAQQESSAESMASEMAPAEAPATQDDVAAADVGVPVVEEAVASSQEKASGEAEPMVRAASAPAETAGSDALPAEPMAAQRLDADEESANADSAMADMPAPPPVQASAASSAPSALRVESGAELSAGAAAAPMAEGGALSARIESAEGDTQMGDAETFASDSAQVQAAQAPVDQVDLAEAEMAVAQESAESSPGEAQAALATATLTLAASTDTQALAKENEPATDTGTQADVYAGESGDGATAVRDTARVAALPTAQPLSPTRQAEQVTAPEAEAAPATNAGAPDLFWLLTIGLLVATVVFGGLWWRSRGAG